MMTTNNSGGPKSGPYIGRIRGLRQGGRKSMAYGTSTSSRSRPKKKGSTGSTGSIGRGARFKSLVSQLSRQPGSNDPAMVNAMTRARSKSARPKSLSKARGRR